MQFNLKFAHHDPSHCLTSGLFRALKRGDRKKLKLDVTYKVGEDKSVRFWGPEPLGVDDMRILQAIIALAGINGLILEPEPKSKLGTQLRLDLDLKFQALKENGIVAQSSFYELLNEIGQDTGGKNIRLAKESLRRLYAVTILVKDGAKEMGYRLLSRYMSDEEDYSLYVALNPLIFKAITGGGKFTYINMDEVRALSKSDTAALLHQRLCAWVDSGKAGKVSLDTLVSYAYYDEQHVEVSKYSVSMRRKRVRNALEELELMGWKVTQYARNKYEIARPIYKRLSD